MRLFVPVFALDFTAFEQSKSLFGQDAVASDPGAVANYLSRTYTHFCDGATGSVRLNPLPIPLATALLPIAFWPLEPMISLACLPLAAFALYPYLNTLAHQQITHEKHAKHQQQLSKEPSQWAGMLNDTFFFQKATSAPVPETQHPDSKCYYAALGLTGREDISLSVRLFVYL
jgi:hypothetical protein